MLNIAAINKCQVHEFGKALDKYMLHKQNVYFWMWWFVKDKIWDIDGYMRNVAAQCYIDAKCPGLVSTTEKHTGRAVQGVCGGPSKHSGSAVVNGCTVQTATNI